LGVVREVLALPRAGVAFLADFLGRLAFEAVERLVLADDLLPLAALAAVFREAGRAAVPRFPVFFFRVFALRAAFLAMESPFRVIRRSAPRLDQAAVSDG